MTGQGAFRQTRGCLLTSVDSRLIFLSDKHRSTMRNSIPGGSGRREWAVGRLTDREVCAMPGNRAVAYIGPGHVEVQTIDYPKLELRDGPGVNPANVGRKCPHGVILRVVSTNICGSDQHMVRGRTTAPKGLVLGHEITGEVIEAGPDVEFIKVGDLVSVPFNIAWGRCRHSQA